MTQEKAIKKILVVDDDRAVCLTVQRFLLEEGYGCQTATDVANTLNMLKNDDFDLVISDIKMPNINGLDLLRHICLEHHRIETIMMTGHTGEYTYSDIIEAGASDFIQKPFEMAELKAKIVRIERERRVLSDLKETNTALGVVLRRVEGDKDKLKTDITLNLKKLVSPLLDKLKGTRLDETQGALLDVLESNLSKITSSFTSSLSQPHLNLSDMEIRIANLIQTGKENKEMAEILGVSINTVKTHRYHLRAKLGLRKEKINLKSYLKSIEL